MPRSAERQLMDVQCCMKFYSARDRLDTIHKEASYRMQYHEYDEMYGEGQCDAIWEFLSESGLMDWHEQYAPEDYPEDAY